MTKTAIKNSFYIAIAFLAVVALIYVYFYYRQDRKIVGVSYDSSCVTPEQRTINGNSMSQTFKNGETVNTLNGYFYCNPPERGQAVVIEFATRDESFVKRIAGIRGDMLEFNEGQAKLNGEVLKNSAGVAYQFGERSQRILSASLYDGIIQDGYFLVLSDDPGASAFDSRQYGFLDKDHLKGLVLMSNE